jgi:hypothetical protein
MDVHRDFCEVAVSDQGQITGGRVLTTPAALELFAQSLSPTDRVALEATGNAAEIARIIGPQVAAVIVLSPHDTAVGRARAKDRSS